MTSFFLSIDGQSYEARPVADDHDAVELTKLTPDGPTYVVNPMRGKCTCPFMQKTYQYRGVCKHITALRLPYVSIPGQCRTEEEDER